MIACGIVRLILAWVASAVRDAAQGPRLRHSRTRERTGALMYTVIPASLYKVLTGCLSNAWLCAGVSGKRRFWLLHILAQYGLSAC